MMLSVELFNEIVSNLKSDGTCSQRNERRSEARVGLRSTLGVVPCTFSAKKSKPLIVHVHDLSAGGIGLVLSFRMEEGTEFVARLSRENHPVVPVLYRVIYCRRISAELSGIGARFERILPDADGEVVPLGRKAAKPKKAAPAAESAPAETPEPADSAIV
jgi:hypothetical protein